MVVLAFLLINLAFEDVFTSEVVYSREEVQKIYPGFGTEWIFLQNQNNDYVVGYFKKTETRSLMLFSPPPEEVVNFTLYTRTNSSGIAVSFENPSFDIKKPAKFITHGWLSNGNGDACISIKDGFLKKYDANVFVMNWGAISRNYNYVGTAMATPSVAKHYSKFINAVVAKGVDPAKIHLVGHSLGAHISGFAAREADGRIGRVTGLDPALPLFNLGVIEGGKLSRNDAEFIDVIHTCAGFLGIEEGIGHADFYPNGGSVPQPGCGDVMHLIEACSHGRSWEYFAASLTAPKPFKAVKCSSLGHFRNGKCMKEWAVMGDGAAATARGRYFLKTNPQPPFIKDA